MKVARNYELKEIDVKNCRCCYFDGMININDLNLANILLEKKSYENILIIRLCIKLYSM